MANLGETFDASQVPPDTGSMDPVPAGAYPVIIVETDVATAKSLKGDVLKFEAEIRTTEFEGQKIFGNLNIRHDNPKAQSIGQAQLSAICHAIGLLHPITDSAELHDQIFAVRAKLTPAQGEYKAKNEITKYMKYDAAAPYGPGCDGTVPKGRDPNQPDPGEPAAVPRAQPQPVAAAPASPPWKKGRAA